jgi:hypothetical protein
MNPSEPTFCLAGSVLLAEYQDPLPITVAIIAFSIVATLVYFAVVSALDKARIENDVLQRGGQVLGFLKGRQGRTTFGDRDNRIYWVEYIDKRGRKIKARAKTSMWAEVWWDEAEEEGPAQSGVTDEIECLKCHAHIPANRKACPRCGWSYENPETGRGKPENY